MKLLFVFLALLPILLELASAVPVTTVDQYGRVHRNSRMSDKPKVQVEEADDEDDDDEEDADDDADDDDDSFYPPDFEKLFPNPDGKPTGPNVNTHYMDHPANPQQGRPSHGPASVRGPASLRGPVRQHAPKPHQRGSYSAGPPQRDGPPPPRRGSGPPPRGYSPRPEYRTELIGYVQEAEEGDGVPAGRQLFVPAGNRRTPVNLGGPYIAGNYRRQTPLMYRPGTNMGYQNRRVIAYPGLAQNGYNRVSYYPARRPVYQNRAPAYYPMNRYPVNRYQGGVVSRRPVGYYPRSSAFQHYFRTPTPVVRARDSFYDDVSNEVEDVPEPRLPRIYNPWSQNPLRGDAYNPEYVVNPTWMRSRRRFRYHPSQRIPIQKVDVYSGHWGNPRNTFYDPRWHGASYHGNYVGSQY